MKEVNTEDLKQAIESQHGGTATLAETKALPRRGRKRPYGMATGKH